MNDLQLTEDAGARRFKLLEALKSVATDCAIVRQLAFEFDRDECWRHLGCNSMWEAIEEGVKHQLGVSWKQIYRYIAEGKALAQGAPEGSSGRALTVFAKLNDDPDMQQKAFADARQSSASERVTEQTAKKSLARAGYKETKKVKNTAATRATVIAKIDDTIKEVDRVDNAPQGIRTLLVEARSAARNWQEF